MWALLTDYRRLGDVVPNLMVNEVLEEYNTDFCKDTIVTVVDKNLSEEVQCQNLANQMKGVLLRQGACVGVGIDSCAVSSKFDRFGFSPP